MGGTKQYDRDDLIHRAADLFHRQGFNGTSTAELVAELGVNRKSMYAEFGSKQGLCEAALDHYNSNSLSGVLAAVEAPDGAADALRETFQGFAIASEEWAQGRGCLLCNTAIERPTLDPASGVHVDAYFARLHAAFSNALTNARRLGEIGEGSDIDDLASFFTMTLIGIAALAKGRAHPDRIHGACRVALGVLDRL